MAAGVKAQKRFFLIESEVDSNLHAVGASVRPLEELIEELRAGPHPHAYLLGSCPYVEGPDTKLNGEITWIRPNLEELAVIKDYIREMKGDLNPERPEPIYSSQLLPPNDWEPWYEKLPKETIQALRDERMPNSVDLLTFMAAIDLGAYSIAAQFPTTFIQDDDNYTSLEVLEAYAGVLVRISSDRLPLALGRLAGLSTSCLIQLLIYTFINFKCPATHLKPLDRVVETYFTTLSAKDKEHLADGIDLLYKYNKDPEKKSGWARCALSKYSNW